MVVSKNQSHRTQHTMWKCPS